MQQRRPVRRALLSVSDKAGIVEFAQALSARGVELLSTGGTARLLADKGLPVTEVSDYTGFPEMMDGRVKTLHPKVHGGILGRRGQDDGIMQQHGIAPIDMVVVNLYPFAQTVAREGCSLEDAFDAIGHSFATIAIGGFSTHDASVGYFNSPMINSIIAIFLLISGCNYGLHFSLLSGRSLKVYWRDPEFGMFIGVQLTLVIVCTLVLWLHNVYGSVLTTLNQAFFQVVSMATTAGFTTDSIARWPLFLPVLLLCSAFIGGCAGSTGGGLKVIRILLLFKQGNRELKRLVHPNAVYSIKLGNRALPERILEAVWGFFSAYALVFIISMLAIIATGVDDFSAFASVVATLNNLGPGLGVVADNFSSMKPVD